MADADTASDLALADTIEALLRSHGGAMPAHLLLVANPELRKQLLDRRLLRFVELFPDRFAIRRDAVNTDLAEIRLFGASLTPGVGASCEGNGFPGLSARAQERSVAAARELADALVSAARRFPQRGAPVWGETSIIGSPPGLTEEGSGNETIVSWVPLPWLVREKTVGKRLQSHVLHSPELDLLHHQNPAIVALLGTKGALWATHAAHLRAFLEAWPQSCSGITAPLVRQRSEVPCAVERRGIAGELHTHGFDCPCRVEISCLPEVDDDAKAAAALRNRVIAVLKGRPMQVHLLGQDTSIHSTFRRCSAAQQVGLLRWLQLEPSLEVVENPPGRWCVSSHCRPGKGSRSITHRSRKEVIVASSSDETVTTNSKLIIDAPLRSIGRGVGVIAVDKPPGITTERTLALLRCQLYKDEADAAPSVTSVSRLDQDTSGVLVAALSGDASAEALKSQYAARQVLKEYVCLCVGPRLGPVGYTGSVSCKLRAGKVRHRVGPSPFGKDAETSFTVVGIFAWPPAAQQSATAIEDCLNDHDDLAFAFRRFSMIHSKHAPSSRSKPSLAAHNGEAGASEDALVLSLLKVRPLTGRTHQIRVHMQLLDCPIFGDYKYGQRFAKALRGRTDGGGLLNCSSRLFLHCLRVRLRDIDGSEFDAASGLPPDLESVIRQLQPLELDHISFNEMLVAGSRCKVERKSGPEW
eukprot:TRINITY_DN16978_c0_g1_i1.p1 TRINITY_DN16978_c0_g1~~TRINITY_DN16978_c0_g1_i1.p1  ORF type:complete len:696 (-),score=82.18 TRINITY_DN16978_c0_g1_i1:89-2176(-)